MSSVSERLLLRGRNRFFRLRRGKARPAGDETADPRTLELADRGGSNDHSPFRRGSVLSRWLVLTALIGILLQAWLWQRGRLELHTVHEDSKIAAVELCGIKKYDRESFTRDQVHLLIPAVDRAMGGSLWPFSKRMSGGGLVPGSLLQILIGEPLKGIFDYRASSSVIVLMHLLAGGLIYMTAYQAQGLRFALMFFMLFWLSPWRLYHGGFLWEPAFIVLPSALHLWAHGRLWTETPSRPGLSWWSLREAPAGIVQASFLLALALSTAPQLHGSAMILFLISGGLLLAGRCRCHLPAFGAGLVVGSATLIPTLMAWNEGALDWVDESNGSTTGHGPLRWLYRLPRALGYWVRLGFLDLGRRYRQTEFFQADGHWGGRLWTTSIALLGLVTALIGLWVGAQWLKGRLTALDKGSFLNRYAQVALAAVLISAVISPVTLQGWHVLVALPACLIAPAAWLCGISSRRFLTALLFMQVVCILLIGFGHPMYAEPTYAEPTYAEPTYAEPTYAEPVTGDCRVLWQAP